MSGDRPSPISTPWAIAVPAIAWWPIAVTFIELRRPPPSGPGVDLVSLLYWPAAIAWLPMIAVASVAATWGGLAMRRRVADSSAAERRGRGLLCGAGALLCGIAVLVILATSYEFD